jgi:hypothetical protein
MSEAKFTKGPWALNKSRVVDIMSNGNNEPVASVCPYNRAPLEVVANAHLIAAAPEMYTLLNRIAELANGDMNNIADEMLCSFDDIELLLAKARG